MKKKGFIHELQGQKKIRAASEKNRKPRKFTYDSPVAHAKETKKPGTRPPMHPLNHSVRKSVRADRIKNILDHLKRDPKED